MSRICITGIAGFIGSHTADMCLRAGHEVTGIDDFSTGLEKNLPPNHDRVFAQGSILHDMLLQAAMTDADYVIHLAARPSVTKSIQDPMLTNKTNIEGTLRVLEMARELKVKRVVVASSSSVYGNSPSLPKHEEMHCAPRSPYAVSKLATEAYAMAFYHSFGLEVMALRYFNVYGPRQRADTDYPAVIPAFISAALNGRPARIYGDGRQTRDFTYVEDVARANLLACFNGSPSVLNICGGRRVSLLELHAEVAGLTGTKQPPLHMPPRPGDVIDSYGDRSAAAAMIGWDPSFSFGAGLTATVDAAKKVIDENARNR